MGIAEFERLSNPEASGASGITDVPKKEFTPIDEHKAEALNKEGDFFAQMKSLSGFIEKKGNELPGEVLKGAGGIAAAAVDRIGTTVGAFDEDTTQKFLDENLPQLGSFYREHNSGLHDLGDLGLSIPLGIVGAAAIRSGSIIGRLFNGTKAQKYLFSSGKSAAELAKPSVRRSVIRARQGTVDFSKTARKADERLNLLRKAALNRRSTDVFKELVAGDVLIATTLHDSELFNPADMNNLELAGMYLVPTAAFTAISRYGQARIISKSIQAAAGKEVKAANARNKVADTFSLPTRRGPKAGVIAMNIKADMELLNSGKLSTNERENVVKRISTNQIFLQEEVQAAFKDIGIKGISSSVSPSKEAIQTVTDFLINNPTGMTAVASLENIGNKEVKGIVLKLTELIRKETKTKADKARIKELLNKAGFVLEHDGETLVPSANRLPLPSDSDSVKVITSGGRVVVKNQGISIAKDGTFRLTNAQPKSPEIIKKGKFIEQKNQERLTRENEKANAALQSIRIPDASSIPAQLFENGEFNLKLGFKKVQEAQNRFQGALRTLGERTSADGEIPLFVRKTKNGMKVTLKEEKGAKLHKFHHTDLAAMRTLENGQVEFALSRRIDIPAFPHSVLSLGTINKIQMGLSHLIRNDLLDPVAKDIDSNTSYLTIDAFIEATKGKDTLRGLVRLKKAPGKILTEDDLRYESIKRKFQTYMEEADYGDAFKQKENSSTLHRKLNLPELPDGEVHPLLTLFESARVAGNFSSKYRNFEDVKKALLELEDPLSVGAGLREDLKFEGPWLRLNPDRKPVQMIVRTEDPNAFQLHKESVMFDLGARVQAEVKRDLLKSKDPIAKAVAEAIYAEPEQLLIAKDVGSIVEGGQSGKGGVLQSSFAAEDIPALNAANQISDVAFKAGEEKIKSVLLPLQESSSRLLSKGNKADLENFNFVAASRRKGWDLLPHEDGRVIGEDGTMILDHKSVKNQQLLDELFPDQGVILKKNMRMPFVQSKTYQEAKLTPLAADTMGKLMEIQSTFFNGFTAARARSGMSAPPAKLGHIPPVDFGKDAKIRYIFGPDHKLIVAVGGNTEAQVSKQVDLELSALRKKGIDGAYALNQEDIRHYKYLRGEAYANPVSFVDATTQTGASKGTSIGSVTETGKNTLLGMIDAAENSLKWLSRTAIADAFQPQLTYAKRMNELLGGIDAEKVRKGRTNFTAYENLLLGIPNVKPNTTITNTYNAIESGYNSVWARASDALINRKLFRRADEKAFNELKDAYKPFKNTADFLAQTTKATLPQTMRRHMSKLTYYTSALTLRAFETGLPVLNMLSLASTLPGTVKALQRAEGESQEQWLSRIAAYGTAVEDVGVLHPGKIMMDAAHTFWNDPEAQRILSIAAERGYLKQEVAERVKTLIAPKESYLENTIRHGIDKVSVLTDKSETLARTMAFWTGYRVGKNVFELSDEAAMRFSHEFANKNIGDFRSSVRPEIFQGAVGMPLGLFTTFAWNFGQRLISFVDRGDTRGLATQLFIQGSLFGADSLPGWKNYVELFTSNYDGTSNLYDRVDPAIADVLAYGSLSALTGIDLGSRASITVPGIVTGGPLDTPIASVLKTTAQGFTEGVKQMKDAGLNKERIAEILGNYAPNRTIRNLNKFALGYDADRNGNLVVEDTRTGLEVASRILGSGTLSRKKERDITRKEMQKKAYDSQVMESLGKDLKAAFRANDSGKSLDNALTKLIDLGVSAEGIRSFLRNALIKGEIEQNDRQLIKALKNGDRANTVERLLNVYDN